MQLLNYQKKNLIVSKQNIKKINMKGEIKIRLGNESQEPMIVYIYSWHKKLELWVCEKLNTGDTVMSKNTQLIDFNYREFKILFYDWKIKNQDINKARFLESLNMWLNKEDETTEIK